MVFVESLFLTIMAFLAFLIIFLFFCMFINVGLAFFISFKFKRNFGVSIRFVSKKTDRFFENKNYLFTNKKEILFLILSFIMCLFLFYFYMVYSELSYKNDQENKIDNMISIYDEKLSSIPNLQYKDFIVKLKSGDFKTYQEVYSIEKEKFIGIFTDRYNTKYYPLMIQNAENNANLSKFYEDIRILNSFNKKYVDKISINNHNAEFYYSRFYCDNEKQFKMFFNNLPIKDIDCSLFINAKN